MTDVDRVKGYAHGAVDYISVPIIPELLRAKVRVFVELHRRARELEMIYGDMRQLSNRLLTVQDEGRRRLARELHDGLGQELTAAKMLVDGIRAAESQRNAAEASQLIENALQQVRTTSHLYIFCTHLYLRSWASNRLCAGTWKDSKSAAGLRPRSKYSHLTFLALRRN